MACINLIIQYVNDNRPKRQMEFDECVRRNFANPHVMTVHNLQEGPDVVVPAEFREHPKYCQVEIGKWMTYRDAFNYANSVLPNKTCCIANLDIFLDSETNWSRAPELLGQKLVFCLARSEFISDGTTWRDAILMRSALAISQDAWLFQTPIVVNDCDFGIGTPGRDNAIAHRFKQAGYQPVNAAHRFKISHFDQFREKTPLNQREIYRRERGQHAASTYPELQGQYVLPDIDLVTNVDQLLKDFKATDLDRYAVVCEIFNKFLKVSNT